MKRVVIAGGVTVVALACILFVTFTPEAHSALVDLSEWVFERFSPHVTAPQLTGVAKIRVGTCTTGFLRERHVDYTISDKTQIARVLAFFNARRDGWFVHFYDDYDDCIGVFLEGRSGQKISNLSVGDAQMFQSNPLMQAGKIFMRPTKNKVNLDKLIACRLVVPAKEFPHRCCFDSTGDMSASGPCD